jgi:predicted component of type VI protein secretion system
VVINDRSISRIHVYLEAKGNKWLIWDNDSNAGTALNDSELQPGQLAPINSGDRVRMGMIPLTFLQPPEFYSLVRALFID